MAIIESTILSSIKGSIGGITFYTGRNGNIARVKKQNTNANSLSQKDARNFLLNSYSGYQNLSAADRASWETWAVTNYYSIRNSESINHGGYVCYRSFQNVINTINSKFIVPTIAGLPGITSLSFTAAALSLISPPTGFHILPNIIDAPGSNYPCIISNVTLTSLNILTFDITFGIIPHVLTVNGQLQDSNSQRYCIEVFISNPGKFQNFKCKNYFTKLIFATKNLTFTVPGLTGYSGIRVSSDCTSNLTGSRYSIISGKYYYISVVFTGVNGSQAVVTTKCILTT